MPVPSQILELVLRFQEHSDEYRSGKYNETQLRRDFLDPFFAALGWDMTNLNKASEQAREVVMEYSLKIEGRNKAPDYCFRSGGADKFFVEAKKPSVNLKDDARAAFQTRTYGWNRGLPFCVLSDFEEFAVYDCRFKPVVTDSAQTARSFYCKYSEYAQQWDQVAALFGREAVQNGALEKQSASSAKKGALPFDADFLRLIEGWRERLAQNIVQRNKSFALSQRDLNFAVQMTIDRILFLRMCEDRDIEPFEQLQNLARGKNIYAELSELFLQADNRYNSGLFHFPTKKRQDADTGDTLTLQLQIDDDVLQGIVYSLYLPNPYNFRVMSVEILGQVYEQFLGKVIRLEKNKATVEDKPEVRKAGGVYYTPAYIVDYIVRQTVGALCEGRTPRDVESLRVLDPACGSGSFLIGAYNYLLEWHLDFYTRGEPEKLAARRDPVVFRAKPSHQPDAPSTWRLTAREKKRILLNNIHGVDIDRQAVEVTKLSLLLKMLEDESGETLPSSQARLLSSQERLLPDLDANIKCGNSLIAHDFYDRELNADLNAEERDRINAFDWQDEFPNIMKAGGFDAVIGNPPFIQSRSGQLAEADKAYYMERFQTAEYQINTYGLFLEKGMRLLKVKGLLGYIIPNYWLATEYDALLRRFLFLENNVQELLNVYRVFNAATVDTLLLLVERPSGNAFPKRTSVRSISRSLKTISQRLLAVKGHDWAYERTLSLNSDAQDVEVSFAEFIKLKAPKFLGDYCITKFGMKPYQEGKGKPPQSRAVVDEKAFSASTQLNDAYEPLLRAADVQRYNLDWKGQWINYGEHLAEPRNKSLFVGPRILLQRIVSRNKLDGTFTDRNFVCNTDVITLKMRTDIESQPSILFIGGIVMSRVCAQVLKNQNVNLDRAAFPKINTNTLSTFPMPDIDFSNKADKARHDQMVKLVERMLELHEQRAKARTGQDQVVIQREIKATDGRIDRLVYELYDLNAEEIAIVEAQ